VTVLAFVLVTLNAMLDRTALDRARADLDAVSGVLLEQADRHLSSAASLVDDLSQSFDDGATLCAPAQREAMLSRTLVLNGVKSTAIVGPVGQVVCDPLGISRRVEVRSSVLDAGETDIQIAAVRFVDPPYSAVRVMRRTPPDTLAFAAFVSSSRFAAGYLPPHLAKAGLVRIQLSDGTMLVQIREGHVARETDEDLVALSDSVRWVRDARKSERFPLEVTLAVPLAEYLHDVEELRSIVNIAAAAVGFVMIGLIFHLTTQPPSPASEIERGIRNGEFVPFYQPVIDIQNGRLAGCEVLIRWRKPDGTIVSPGAFIGLAEATGLAIPMTRALMEKTRDELAAAYEKRPQLKVSINLFDDHFDNLGIVKDVQTIFDGAGVRYEQLVFEITERQPLPNIDKAKVIIRRLRDLGARVALDDAGTGHGGLAYLQQLGMDVIKIDKLFIDQIDAETTSAPIVDALIDIGRRMGMLVIAEGVETFDQVHYLRQRGVEQAQGYVFAPALSTKSYLDLLERMDPIDRATTAGSGGASSGDPAGEGAARPWPTAAGAIGRDRARAA
jgi:EAL domain-containing protein (putative c-di-GMP-specific phosphodiesterase class I)